MRFLWLSTTFSLFVAFLAVFLLLRPWLAGKAWQPLAALSGSWVGGTANQIAVKEAIGMSDALLARLRHYQTLLPEVAARTRPRHHDMPYRMLVDLMRGRLEATLADAPGAYASPDEFAGDIELILRSLADNRGLHAGWRWRARC